MGKRQSEGVFGAVGEGESGAARTREVRLVAICCPMLKWRRNRGLLGAGLAAGAARLRHANMPTACSIGCTPTGAAPLSLLLLCVAAAVPVPNKWKQAAGRLPELLGCPCRP